MSYQINNRTDEIKDKLHQRIIIEEDVIWMLKTINRLQVELHIARQQDYDHSYNDKCGELDAE